MGEHFRDNEEKITLGMIVVGVTIIVILMTALIVYLASDSSNTDGELRTSSIDNTGKDSTNSSESTSTTIGKTVNEVLNELSVEEPNTITNEAAEEESKVEATTLTNTNSISENSNSTENEVEETTTKEVKFIAPIKGEILRDFAPDSLVYSETLEEWITHNGVDIKADKTSVVVAAAAGKVSAIKNDPRYGLTVIVDHENGYQTIYANLLTAEFVVEGEDLDEGQTIGTIGNSATFEISDEYHLHFELKQNGEYLNPNTYIEF